MLERSLLLERGGLHGSNLGAKVESMLGPKEVLDVVGEKKVLLLHEGQSQPWDFIAVQEAVVGAAYTGLVVVVEANDKCLGRSCLRVIRS